MTAADEDPTAAAPMPPPKPGSTARAIVLTVTVVLVVAGTWFALWYNSDEKQATRACEAWVRDQLKTPATAQFSDEHFTEAKYSFSGKPEVHGKVDAQNGFGAMIRGVFQCTMSHDSGDWVATDGYVI